MGTQWRYKCYHEKKITHEQCQKQELPAIYIAFFIALGLWFAHEIIGVLFLFFFAIVLTLILNAPVMWLVAKRISRTAASLIVFFAMLLFLFFFRLVGFTSHYGAD